MGARDRIFALLDGTRSSPVLAAQSYSDISYVCRVLSRGRKAGTVYISGWEKTATRHRALYMAGVGDDVQRPNSSSTVRVKQMLERMSADDRDRLRNRNNAKRRVIKPDRLTRAFFGR
tara:strand:+ start:516 stop:869 length:354 start_codon:yes stop_codon:yes gene_type:complete